MNEDQKLIEEALFLTDLINQFTPQRIESVPMARKLFKILSTRLKFVKRKIRNG